MIFLELTVLEWLLLPVLIVMFWGLAYLAKERDWVVGGSLGVVVWLMCVAMLVGFK